MGQSSPSSGLAVLEVLARPTRHARPQRPNGVSRLAGRRRGDAVVVDVVLAAHHRTGQAMWAWLSSARLISTVSASVQIGITVERDEQADDFDGVVLAGFVFARRCCPCRCSNTSTLWLASGLSSCNSFHVGTVTTPSAAALADASQPRRRKHEQPGYRIGIARLVRLEGRPMGGKDLVAPRFVEIEPCWLRLGQRSPCTFGRHVSTRVVTPSRRRERVGGRSGLSFGSASMTPARPSRPRFQNGDGGWRRGWGAVRMGRCGLSRCSRRRRRSCSPSAWAMRSSG